jgi:hypothetical protein
MDQIRLIYTSVWFGLFHVEGHIYNVSEFVLERWIPPYIYIYRPVDLRKSKFQSSETTLFNANPP